MHCMSSNNVHPVCIVCEASCSPSPSCKQRPSSVAIATVHYSAFHDAASQRSSRCSNKHATQPSSSLQPSTLKPKKHTAIYSSSCS
ncbi:hypothetical protein Dimus_021132, partial [Dionaea muscipula]